MMNEQEKLQAQYKYALQSKQLLEKRLFDLRSQTQRVIQARKEIEAYRKEQMVRLTHNLKEAIKKRDFKSIAKYSKNISKVEREMKSYKSLGITSYKINLLTKQNLAIEKQIQAKIQAMAMREARARNIITKSIAKVSNNIDSVKLKMMNLKSDWKQYRLKNTVEKYNKKYALSINYKAKQLNSDLNIDKKINTNSLGIKTLQTVNTQMNYNKIKENYSKVSKGKTTIYTNKKNGVEVVDKGDTLKLSDNSKNLSDEEKINALLDVAEAKGWDLSKIEVHGNKEFKAKSQAMINERLGKTNEVVNQTNANSVDKSVNTDKHSIAMKNMYEELNRLKAENEKLKQQIKTQKLPKLDNTFGAMNKMKSNSIKTEDLKALNEKSKSSQNQKNTISRF